MTPDPLVTGIRNAFGKDGFFDTSAVLIRAEQDAGLSKAIDAAIPHAFYRSGYQRGRVRDRPLRRMLTRLARDHFYVETETGRGWWKLK